MRCAAVAAFLGIVLLVPAVQGGEKDSRVPALVASGHDVEAEVRGIR